MLKITKVSIVLSLDDFNANYSVHGISVYLAGKKIRT